MLITVSAAASSAATFAGAGVLGHDGAALRPHDVAGAWSGDPLTIAPIALGAILYWRGWRPGDGARRAYCWWAGWLIVVVAILSPVGAIADVLLVGHMVQHVLLVAVAAPLVAAASPGPALLRGLPATLRRTVAAAPRRLGVGVSARRRSRHPIARWLAFVGTFWMWHASALYGAAVRSRWLHLLEHGMFFTSSLLLWTVILGPSRVRIDRGVSVILVFLLGLQSVLLSALLTFARAPFYEPYAGGASGWRLDPLSDQQLAGLVMWIPSGLLLTGIALALLVTWLRELDEPDPALRASHRAAPPTRGGRIDERRLTP